MVIPIKKYFGLKNLEFNTSKPNFMHIDINSCFATIEQQANPFLRGKPIAVIARDTKQACILAASIEAKKMGIKTGTRADEARLIFKDIIFLTPDVEKYKYVHHKLKNILDNYFFEVIPKSIDEFVVNLNSGNKEISSKPIYQINKEIKKDIKNEIGEWITVSIGAGPNKFLAKTGAGIKKPDGFVFIDSNNFMSIYKNLKLTDLNGINIRYSDRLNRKGIFDVISFYNSNLTTLKEVFESVLAEYWYLKLRGWEVPVSIEKPKTVGHSLVLPKSLKTEAEINPIIIGLTEKLGFRLRKNNFSAAGIHLGILFTQNIYWHKGKKLQIKIFESTDIYKNVFAILKECPYVNQLLVRKISITCFNLSELKYFQLQLFEKPYNKLAFSESIDKINSQWGDMTIYPASMLKTKVRIKNNIAFGYFC